MCYREPLVEIIDETGDYLYGEINEEKAMEIIEKHVKNSEPVKDYIVYSDLFETEDTEFNKNQVKIVLRNCGYMDPESLEEYEARKGYEALRKILVWVNHMTSRGRFQDRM